MMNLIAALNEFRTNTTIEKTGVNTYHNNSKYHTIDDLLKGLRGCDKFGLGFYQVFEGNDLITVIVHAESGEEMRSRIHIGDYTEAQKWAGAVTYKRRIALVTMFGLGEPDADGNETINTPVRQNAMSDSKPAATNQATSAVIDADYDYCGAPYRMFHVDGSIKAEFTEVKPWGLAMKKMLSAANVDSRLRDANRQEINRIYIESENDDLMHHATKKALMKAMNSLKGLVPDA